MSLLTELPELTQNYSIIKEQQADYQTNGHILLRNILNQDEVSSYRDVIVDAADRFNTEKRKMEDRDTYGKAFLQIMNLWEVDEA
jgi:hypothetical protein